MLVVDALYRQHERRAAESVESKLFSASSGHHTSEWETNSWQDFVSSYNVHVETIRKCSLHLAHARVATKENKDKAKTLQWLPAVHFLESALKFL